MSACVSVFMCVQASTRFLKQGGAVPPPLDF